MKTYFSRLLALVLIIVIGLMGCSTNVAGLTGNYSQDTLTVLDTITTAIELPEESPKKEAVQDLARKQINDYVSRYRRDTKTAGLRSFTTMQTALNSLAGYYTSYGNRPLPEDLKARLKKEFRQVELAVKRGS